MITQTSNGITVIIDNGTVTINREIITIPNKLKKSLQKGSNIYQTNNDLFINGYQYLGYDKWKRTLKGIWNCYFK